MFVSDKHMMKSYEIIPRELGHHSRCNPDVIKRSAAERLSADPG